MSVRPRPSALSEREVGNLGLITKMMPSCVVVAQGTLDPLAQVRVLARQLLIFVVSYQRVSLSKVIDSPIAQR